MINKYLTFLIVDDVVAMRNAVNALLRSLGYINILAAKDGAEALRILKSQPVDVIISDWEMPVMDGLALLKAVRAEPRLQNLPFLMTSNGTNRQRISEVIQSGASDFLLKPYTGRDMAARIEKVVSWTPREMPAVLTASDKKKSDRPTILAVDDMPDNLFLLSNLFKDEYRVRAANNGETALAICQSDDPPDLVLLDVMMPSMNGFEVAKRLREHPVSEHIPIIFITAMGNNDARLKGFELGAVDFIAKPINPDVLKPRVRNFMHYVEMNKQLQAEYDAMQELGKLKDDVRNLLRCDIRTPLADAIGVIQALADDDSLNAMQLDKLNAAEKKLLHTLNTANLSFELYKIEAGVFQLNALPVNIENTLRRLAAIYRDLYKAKQLNVMLSDDISGETIPQCFGDAMLCYSLFNNILKRACEAAPEKSIVLITIVNEDPVRIMVQNTGIAPPGIRPIFFNKITSQDRSATGRVGMYAARLFTEAQNGSIDLEILENVNSTSVVVGLPRF
jgi:two-component system sensor histidine kinase/response regulator